jgi:hypothetical protein
MQWQQSCRLRHTQCISSHGRPMPDRLLFLGVKRSIEFVQLVEPKDEIGHYVALSYCWGGKSQYMLTAETRSDMEKGIGLGCLPKTIQDAIELTGQLRISYIWIDALCILQDSRQDWERQSANMGSIYQNACLTLVASRAAAVTEGFLQPTKQHAVYCGIVDYRGQNESVFLVAKSSNIPVPLSKRGWAYQERELSSCKVVFGSAEMIWECRQATASESVNTKRPPHPPPEPMVGNTNWSSLAVRCSGSSLTQSRDRLPAISGTAKRYADISGDEYLAGHWKSTLVQSLVWRIMESCDPAKQTHGYIGPSWSWASVVHMKHEFDGPASPEVVAQLTDYSIALAGANPYGEVMDGWIELSAPMFGIDHCLLPPDPYFRLPVTNYTADQFARAASGVSEGEVHGACRGYCWDSAAEVFWDWIDLTSVSTSLSCVVLTRAQRSQSLFGNVVQPVPYRLDTFRRVGMFRNCIDVFTTDDTRVRTIRIL